MFRILALLDDRPGNNTQVLGVAQALARETGADIQEITLAYNGWIRLPNWLLGASLCGLTKQSREQMQGTPSLTLPLQGGGDQGGSSKIATIAIAAGRRATPVLRWLKKQHPALFTVQLMWPGAPTGGLDLIAVPEHDGIATQGNIITTPGAPNRLTPEALKVAAQEWEAEFASYPTPRIAVLVGGSTKHGIFSPAESKLLAQRLNKLAQQVGGSLLISTSRRTDAHILADLRENITVPHHLYAWEPGGANPYMGLLALAECIVVTGDSIAMASEACDTGKPVYLYQPTACLPPKHQRFLRSLIERGYARDLGEPLTVWEYTPPHAADEVANTILARLRLVEN